MKITIKPTLKQHEFYEALKKYSTVFFGGGAGGGKSWALCESRLIKALMYPEYKTFIGREELKRLMQSTFITFVKVTKHHNIPRSYWKLDGKYNYIQFRNGSRIDLLDLKYLPSDPLYERFGSLEYTDGAIEEAGEIHFLAYDTLKSRINRHLNREYGIKATMAITGNPKKNWTYRTFYLPAKNGTLPKDYKFIQSLYNDNPYTSESYHEQLSGIKDKNLRERLKEGNWEYDDDPTALIAYKNIHNMWHNEHVTEGEKYIIADIARYGSDKSIITVWSGFKVIDYEIMLRSSLQDLHLSIKTFMIKHEIPVSNVLADESGVGGGIVDSLNINGFIANSKPIDEGYQSLKDECGYKLAGLFENDRVYFEKYATESVKEDIETELGQLKTFESEKDNKLKICPKEKIKENIGRSPDWLDVFIMRMYFEIIDTKWEVW
jgi:hypothetical protein